MSAPITLYFDLVSPYVWLALHAVEHIRRESGREVLPVPVAFGAILKRHRQPAPVDVPGKRAHILNDIAWRAAERGLVLTGPPVHPFRSLHGLRLCLAVDDPAQRAALALRLADAAWVHGRDLQDPEVVIHTATACGLDAAWARACLDDPAVKQALVVVTDQAADDGVFGVPTFELAGQLFWGTDRIPHLLAAAAGESPGSVLARRRGSGSQ